TFAVRHGRHFKVHAVIYVLRLALAQVPRNSRSPDHRTGKAPGNCVFFAYLGDVDVALLEDAVVGNQADRILEQARQTGVDPVANVRQQLKRNVATHATGAEPRRVHTRAGSALVEAHAVCAPPAQPPGRGP